MTAPHPSPLSALCEVWADTPEAHRLVWDRCTQAVQATPWLRRHRAYVEEGGFGYGDLPYHWLWAVLVDEMPANFKFLEVGVFQGQILSLVALCAQKAHKQAHCTGVTPLNETGDKYATHPDIDYLSRIKQIHMDHQIQRAPKILKGMSYDPRIQTLAEEGGPYDLVYIDGCHDYEVVVDDLAVYGATVKLGGFLVIDDAACSLKMPTGMVPTDFFGLEDVTRAVDEFAAGDSTYAPVCSVGHIRVFQRQFWPRPAGG